MQEEPASITIKNENVSELLQHDIPYKLGKYEIKDELGRGTSGIVYRGFDPLVRRDVAIKVGWSENPQQPNEIPQNTLPGFNVFSEAHAAGKLLHPNIVAIYDAQTEKELSYIVMEFIEGETLLEYCRVNGKRLPLKKVLECMFKCCLALDFSHQAGVIHRDIKPSNIMLTKEGETKIMDFSIAEIAQNKTSRSELIIGSPNYMSPEQVRRRAICPQSDLYSLAAVMYQLLTGKTLFPKGSVKQIFYDIVHTPPPKLQDSRPDLPQMLSAIIEKALSKNPEERYQSGKEMAAAIDAIYDSVAFAEHNINLDEKRPSLLRLPFFSNFTSENLDELMTVSSVLKFAGDEVISKEGDIDNSYYLIIQGKANLIRQNKLLAQLQQGDCFGELRGSTQHARTTTMQAAVDIYVLKVNAIRIDTLTKETQLLFYKAFTNNLITRLASPQRPA